MRVFWILQTNRLLTVLPAVLVSIGISLAAEPDETPPEGAYSPTHRLVFFAVLEGCYNDGLTSAEIDLSIPKHPERGHRDLTVNLVATCPLCAPAFNAFQVDASQPELGQMRKKGEAALKRFVDGEHGEVLQQTYQGWEECPVCSGAAPMAKAG